MSFHTARVKKRKSRHWPDGVCCEPWQKTASYEPQLKAMFETSAEVLGGLIKAFRDYEQKNESAWRKAS
jgi:hypothetical protein